MADGLLSLSWNNHKATFCHILSTLREKERYTDVTLACEGKFYPVHKLVLSTCSEYFESMFEHTPCKHPIIVLKDIKSDEVESLLSYMYAGVVNVAQNDLARLIKAAETLKVKGLAVPDEPPPEALPKKSHPPPWSSRDDRSSPHPKRKRREEPEPPVADLQMSSSPPASPKASPYHPANDFQLDRVPNDPKASDSRTDITLERGGEDDSQPDQKSNSRGDHQPPSQPSPLQVVVDDTLVKEEIEEPLEDNQETLLNSGMDYSSMPSDSRLESTANEGGGQDHNQLLPNKFEQPLVSGQQQQPHLPESVVEALAGPSGMQGWLGSGDIGGGFSGVEGYSGDGRHQDLRQAVPSQQPQPHQMVALERDCQMSEQSGPQPPARRRPPSSDRMHKCPHCSYSTIYITNYRNHLRTHTGEKPFSCTYCQYRTTTKKTLTEHIRTHTGEKPYTCSYCTYGATTKQGLNRHNLIHTGEKPFACTYCPYRAREKSALRHHMLALHTLKTNTT